MSFLLISVANRLGCESVNVDDILTYKKIFVLALRKARTKRDLDGRAVGGGGPVGRVCARFSAIS